MRIMILHYHSGILFNITQEVEETLRF